MTKIRIKPKFIGKYMRLAKQVAEDQNPCFSRNIGAVIVDPILNRIVGSGYNGPPPGVPHCDSEEHLKEFFWPQLTDEEKESIRLEVGGIDSNISNCVHEFAAPNDYQCKKCGVTRTQLRDTKGQQTYYYTVDAFAAKYKGCGTCPRRLVKAASGQRNELCSCGHAERHAITNACCPLHNTIMFIWGAVGLCLQCSDAVIQAGIKTIYGVEGPDYHAQSRWLLSKAGVEYIEYPLETYLGDTSSL